MLMERRTLLVTRFLGFLIRRQNEAVRQRLLRVAVTASSIERVYSSYTDTQFAGSARPTQARAAMQLPFIFAWVTPLVRRGWRVRLTLADVRGGAVGAATPKTVELLQRYDAVVGSFEQRMWKLARLRLVGSATLYAVYTCTQLAQPLLLRRVIQSVQEDSAEGIWYAVAVGVLVSVGSGCKEQQLMINFRIGVELRALTVALVYRRALAVREAELPRSMVNLFTMDAQKLLEALPLINLPWAAPLQIAVAGGILVTLAGILTHDGSDPNPNS